MPKGPLGFRRLSTVGPFVKPDKILPAHKTDPGIYSHIKLDKTQPKTYNDTALVIEEESMYLEDFDWSPISTIISINDTKWKYGKMSLSNILEGNNFALELTKVMSKFEDKYGSFDMIDRDSMSNKQIEKEINAFFNDEDSIFESEEELDGIAGGIVQRYKAGDTRELKIDKQKIVEDFIRVLDINDTIRSSMEYWPPTVEKDAKAEALGFGTIDGSHRTVALAQILGPDESIFVWEWNNQEEFY